VGSTDMVGNRGAPLSPSTNVSVMPSSTAQDPPTDVSRMVFSPGLSSSVLKVMPRQSGRVWPGSDSTPSDVPWGGNTTVAASPLISARCRWPYWPCEPTRAISRWPSPAGT